MSQHYQYLKLPKIDKRYIVKMKDLGLTLAEDLCKNPNKLTSVGYEHPYNRVTVSKMWADTETKYIGHNEYTGLDHECYEYLFDLLDPYNFIDLEVKMIVFVNVIEKNFDHPENLLKLVRETNFSADRFAVFANSPEVMRA